MRYDPVDDQPPRFSPLTPTHPPAASTRFLGMSDEQNGIDNRQQWSLQGGTLPLENASPLELALDNSVRTARAEAGNREFEADFHKTLKAVDVSKWGDSVRLSALKRSHEREDDLGSLDTSGAGKPQKNVQISRPQPRLASRPVNPSTSGTGVSLELTDRLRKLYHTPPGAFDRVAAPKFNERELGELHDTQMSKSSSSSSVNTTGAIASSPPPPAKRVKA